LDTLPYELSLLKDLKDVKLKNNTLTWVPKDAVASTQALLTYLKYGREEQEAEYVLEKEKKKEKEIEKERREREKRGEKRTIKNSDRKEE
jgi:hypothetical protein